MICKYLVVLSSDEKVATLDNGITLLIEVVEKSSFIRIKLQVGVNTLCSVTGKLTFHKLMILCTNNMHSYCNISELLALWEEFWNYKNSSSNHARALIIYHFYKEMRKSLQICALMTMNGQHLHTKYHGHRLPYQRSHFNSTQNN